MQTLSDTQICSAALAAIGQLPIADINDTTPNAAKCRAVYYGLRDKLLRRYDWNFARQRALLQPLSTPPVFGWSYAYGLPSDCLAVRVCNGNRLPWRIEGNSLLTNIANVAGVTLPAGYPTTSQSPAGACNIIYTAQVTESGLFDASFADLLALFVASRVAYSITKDKSIAAGAMQQYMQAGSEAKSVAASEGYAANQNRAEEHSSWLSARGGWGRVYPEGQF